MRCKCTGWFWCSRRRTWIYNGKCYQHAMSYNFNMNSCISLSKFWTIYCISFITHSIKCLINIFPRSTRHTCIRTFLFLLDYLMYILKHILPLNIKKPHWNYSLLTMHTGFFSCYIKQRMMYNWNTNDNVPKPSSMLGDWPWIILVAIISFSLVSCSLFPPSFCSNNCKVAKCTDSAKDLLLRS